MDIVSLWVDPFRDCVKGFMVERGDARTVFSKPLRRPSLACRSPDRERNLARRRGQPPFLQAIRIPSPLRFVKRAIWVLLDVPPELGRVHYLLARASDRALRDAI
jgi:hypothetical protein